MLSALSTGFPACHFPSCRASNNWFCEPYATELKEYKQICIGIRFFLLFCMSQTSWGFTLQLFLDSMFYHLTFSLFYFFSFFKVHFFILGWMAKFVPGQSECQNSLKDFRNRLTALNSGDHSTIFESSQEWAVQTVQGLYIRPREYNGGTHDSAKTMVEIEICDG